ncbi:DUF2470 domain-containing protein [Rariglobus hedericola]|uniref:DUF2470 domain-containing protein n=1 Tax=Rariglobus hedericola TaxID=2597822 RepID=A0A556QME8_9BACT|nr:DUF2470 domain-containing protein [Rariglobus hedericola]TSJ77795.1 DUF2470 domain-containing protein [Rariglobus hedericola]
MSSTDALANSSTDSFFPAEKAAHILDHMNEDHADSILNYAHHFARRSAATAARLSGIDQTGMDLVVTEPAGETSVRIAFEKPLTSPEDAHMVLVGMARAARQPAAANPDAATAKARAAIDQLKSGLRTAMLGTASAAGEPDASVVPVVLSADGTLHTYVSEMSAHTKNLRESGRASVMVIEDENTAAQLLARKRLTLRCAAAFIERDTPVFATVMSAMKEKFGPVMQHLEGMTDFHVVQLTPARGRLVCGFGQAFDVDPIDWTKVSHVGGDGQGHGHTARK